MAQRKIRRARLLVMVKEPRPGRVKTRLAHDVGSVAAARWYRAQVLALLRRVRDPRWELVLAVAPDREGVLSRVWPLDLARMPQGRGDLGARMGRILRTAPPGPVCVIGSDIPGIERGHIARAFAALGSCRAVFGPAPDGGFWLVGLKRVSGVPVGLFDGVRWSSEFALADSVATLQDHPVAFVDSLRDVDTAADLAMTLSARHASHRP